MALPLLDLDHDQCRWPVNDGGPFLFCADPVGGSSSYCALHAALSVGEGTRGERTAAQVLKDQVARETLVSVE